MIEKRSNPKKILKSGATPKRLEMVAPLFSIIRCLSQI